MEPTMEELKPETIKISVRSDYPFGQAANAAAYNYRKKHQLPEYSEVRVRLVDMLIAPDLENIQYNFKVDLYV